MGSDIIMFLLKLKDILEKKNYFENVTFVLSKKQKEFHTKKYLSTFNKNFNCKVCHV